MQQDTILRIDVLRALDTGEPFSMVFITLDKKRGTGGKIKRVKSHQKVIGDSAEIRQPNQFSKVFSISRNPNHIDHKTVNIFNPAKPNDHIIKVHWRLITHFNGKRVIG